MNLQCPVPKPRRGWIVLDKYGWPVERIRGRPITNFIRCLLHGRKILRRKNWNPPRQKPDPHTCSFMEEVSGE